MRLPTIDTRRIGQEREPLIVIDDFANDTDALRAAAIGGAFTSAGNHYPGIQAPLPDGYLRDQFPVIARALGRSFGPYREIRVIDASVSIVTQPPAALDVRQRVPHVDAYGRNRIALIHYLSPSQRDGTAFFRHRATGFETIDDARAPDFFGLLRQEVEARPPTGYIAADTPLFERTALVDAQYNRALLYRSHVLHSGAIAPDAELSPDPSTGRLTITAFLELA